ncbi:stefin-1-like [Anoplopoma fimbria]|uniref:Cystatin-B n=1 Tax=Anoplopoma fimbria TaxID=229290 RepID=C3KHW3_ANOFI|nr:stefin-1-like [Anoplopoma fimbria]ACQ58235.1 Cystatin-A1 [Anoplopoma fimbria]
MADKVDNFGGWSETKDATDETQKICNQVKDQVEKRSGKKYRDFEAVKYRAQFLAGGEHVLIQVHVGAEDYIHLSISKIVGTLKGQNYELRGVEQHKTKEDPLVPFKN